MESRVRASPEQLSTLLEYMETHGDLARPLAGPLGRVRSDRQWTKLTIILNAVGGGVSKTTDKWKKVWADWKSKTKKKALTIRHHARGTGVGPARRQTLSGSEKRVLAIMGAVPTDLLRTLGQQPVKSSPPASPAPTAPSPPASPAPTAPSPPASPAPTTPRRRRAPAPRASTSPSEESILKSPARPQSATSPDRLRLRARRKRAQTPFEKATSEFTAIELRRLELEEARTRQQHERDMRALEVEHDRNQVFRSLVNVAQAWLDYYRSRDNTEPLNTE